MRGLWFGLIASIALGCSDEPDFVVSVRPMQCDIGSRIFRQGFPESLDVLFLVGTTNGCNVTRRPTDEKFKEWWGRPTAIMDCNTIIPIPFWTEVGADGVVSTVHLCPETCERIRNDIQVALNNDECAKMLMPAVNPPPPAAGAAGGVAGASGVAGAAGGSS